MLKTQTIHIGDNEIVTLSAGGDNIVSFSRQDARVPSMVLVRITSIWNSSPSEAGVDIVSVHLEKRPPAEGFTHVLLSNNKVLTPVFSEENFDAIVASYDQIASAVNSEPEVVPVPVRIPNLSFAQLLIGLVTEGWITETEGGAWLVGTLPDVVLLVISMLPQDQQFAAKARAIRPSEIIRDDPLVSALALAQGKTTEEIDDFFVNYSGV